jgi:peptidoglycan/xylan/chitin deacetylase (PgdA/CDA1 family)
MPRGYRKFPLPILAVLIGVFIFGSCTPSTQTQVLYNAKIVTIKDGDTLPGLAKSYLSDPSKSYVIAEFNNKTAVAAGQKIIIPLIPLGRGGLNTYGYQTVPVLRYQKFSRQRSEPFVLTGRIFESQLAFLKREGYHVINMNQLLDFLEFNDQIPKKSVVITIDDERHTVLDIAYPVLKKYGFPATLFIQTEHIGEKDALSWPEVRFLSREGLDIQCRSTTFQKRKELQTKQNFNRYIKELDNELSRSKATMRRELGKNCEYLAYPDGPTNTIIVAFAKKYGFRAGFMTKGKSNPFFVNNHWVGRSTVPGDGDLNKFKQHLTVFETMALR